MKKIRISLMALFAITAVGMSFTTFSEPGEPGPAFRCMHASGKNVEQFWLTQSEWFCEVKHTDLVNDGKHGGSNPEDCTVYAEPID